MTTRWILPALLVSALALSGCDLHVVKEGPATANVGDQFAYTITVGNSPFQPVGEDPAGGAVVRGVIGGGLPQMATVTDTLPPQVMLVSAVASQGSCTETAPVVCELGTIGVGNAATVTITVKAIAPGTAENTVSVSGDEPDPDQTDNVDIVVTQIGGATTTTTSSTTTTTLGGAEVCGNCVDDDGDGLVDLDDPACCGAGAINARKLKLRVIPKNGLVHFVQIGGLLDTKLPGRLADDIVLQLSQPAIGTLVCALFPLEKLFNRKASHRFDDRKRTVASAEGFQRAELAKAKGNATNVRARGRLVDLLHFPAVGPGRFAVSFEDAAGPHCAAGSFTFKQARKKSLRAP